MKKTLVCWRCGAAVKPDQRPINRLEQCRGCQADLHVCRLCRSWNPRMTGYCDHDHAEPPLERERANFCQYYKPRPGAFTPGEQDVDRDARKELDSLFEKPPDDAPAQDSNEAVGKLESDRTRAELERLFNKPSQDDG
ncbi:MAG: hypothetical protein OEU44_09015 [Gammaproteobacteria bacterium]|nr:hypothetical protein [Gammaproteobacteria bacterium]